MFFRQYQLGCLSLYSYLVGDETTGHAVVIDPQRDVARYIAEADAQGLRIERVIETHFHADFVSGHLELAAATGAAISYGEGANPDFPIEPLADGTRLSLGEVTLEVLATPGHTPESISVVIHDRDVTWGVLTGDALFVGDVGRPDLLASSGWTADELARRLYRSLHDKLLALPDAAFVFPAHGAGSACGKSMSPAPVSTIGEERARNYALQPMSEDEFVAAVLEGQAVAPRYFPFAAGVNRRQRAPFDEDAPLCRLDWDAFEQARADGAIGLDTRGSPEIFASGHAVGSVNVGLDGRFAEYAGDVVRPDQAIVLVTEPGREGEARTRLARIGFDTVRGALVEAEATLVAHSDAARTAPRLAAPDLAAWRADEPDLQVVDVRDPAEQEEGIVPGAILLPLPRLLDGMDTLDPSRPTVVYCAGGYRSSIAASVMRAHGFEEVADVLGGFAAWRSAGLALELSSTTRT